MNNLIFWIIVCSWLIPLGIRMYNKSRARRLQDGNFRGPGYPPQNYPTQNYPGPGYPPQNYPPQNYHGYPAGPTDVRPVDEAPQGGSSSSPSSPAPLPIGSPEPQGYRARKLAELDAKYSDGEIAMEDYMKQRGEIMNG